MKIVTDCAADMPNEELRNWGCAGSAIQFPEGESWHDIYPQMSSIIALKR